MKVFKILGLAVLTLVLSNSCDDSDSVLSGVEGGLVEINSSLNYIVGNQGPYTASFQIHQGTVKTTKVEITKTFHTTVTVQNQDESTTTEAVQSNTVTMATFEIEDLTKDNFKSFSFTFSDLIDGLTIDGASLSASDGDYQIGDYWELKYLATTDDGGKVQQNKTTKVTVATRFAGTYKCVEGVYYRLGVETYTTSDWPEETLIESVDATTYRVVEYFGPFDGNEFYFTIDPATNKISYPAETPDGDPQAGNGEEFITCETNPADMAIVHCENSNYAVMDEAEGKDRLYMSFGYYTSGSGPRVFYQVMEKIVE